MTALISGGKPSSPTFNYVTAKATPVIYLTGYFCGHVVIAGLIQHDMLAILLVMIFWDGFRSASSCNPDITAFLLVPNLNLPSFSLKPLPPFHVYDEILYSPRKYRFFSLLLGLGMLLP